MTALPEVMRQSEFLHQLVLSRGAMEDWGRIEVIWMYPPAHRVLGFVCKAGFLGNRKLAFKLTQLEAIGGDSVITWGEPDETDAERVRQLESLLQAEVWSEAGHKLGRIIDFEFNLQTGFVTHYLVVGDRFQSLTGSIYRVSPHRITQVGRERILVAETALAQFPLHRAGLQDKISQVGATLKDEYEDATDELRSLAKRAKETTQQTTEQLKTLAEQAKERALQLTEQVRDRVQDVNEQWLDDLETLGDKARETGQTVGRRVQSTAHDWEEQRWHSATVNVPAQAVTDELDDDIDELDDDWDWDNLDPTQPIVSPTPVPSPSPSAPSASSPPSPLITPPPKFHVQPAPSSADPWATDDIWGDEEEWTAPSASCPPLPRHPNPTPAPDEDTWVITADLTLERAAIADPPPPPATPDPDMVWDDPWDITEPPDASDATLGTPLNLPDPAPAVRPSPAPVRRDRPDRTPPPTDSPTDDEDEPWI